LSVIEIKNITKVYQMGDSKVRALDGVSLRVEAGDFVAIMGASGSGKSTMLQILGLLDTPDSGSYKLLGREVSSLQEDELASVRSRTLGFVFQQFNLLSRTSALENVALPLLYSDPGASHGDPRELLSTVGLGERTGHKSNQLSGGQQQRVAIARALVNNPRLILADEPTGNLDSKSSEEIIRLLGKMNEKGITVVMVTHEPDIARYARRVITMKDGKILSDRRRGSASRSAKEPTLKGPSKSGGRLNLRQAKEYYRQALRALLANKVRSALSILGVLIGVMAVIAGQAIGTGAQKSIEAAMASLGTNLLTLRPGSLAVGGVQQGTGGTSRITLQDVDAIATVPLVKRVSPEVSGRVQVTYADKNWSTSVTGTTPVYADMKSSKPIYGRFFSEDDVKRRNRVAVLGLTVIQKIFGENTNPVGEMVKINRVNFQVIGVLPVKGSNGFQDQDDAILVPVTTAMYRLLGQQYVRQVNIEADSAEVTGPVAEAVAAFMKKLKHIPDKPGTEDAYQVRNMAEFQAARNAQTQILTTLLTGIAAISLLVGGIGIMNIMLVSVTERTREIGLRKAIGARRVDILSQFLIESVVVSLIGGLLGVLLGWVIAKGFFLVLGWTTVVTPLAIVISTFFSAVVGMAAGIWPAYKASRLSPILALRYE
jgi:macrolide transport system ATP-binding/permease protein